MREGEGRRVKKKEGMVVNGTRFEREGRTNNTFTLHLHPSKMKPFFESKKLSQPFKQFKCLQNAFE